MDHDTAKKKYPNLAAELDTARSMYEMANSPTGKYLYQNKQEEFNVLISELFTHAKAWDEEKLRYTIVKMEVLQGEIKRLQESKELYERLLSDIESGEYDKEPED